MLSSNYAFIIENDFPANRWKGGYVFGVWQFFICNVYFHASWPLTRRAGPDKIPVVCFEIVGLFNHESPLVVTPLNSLDSDQVRNSIRFQTAWNYDVFMNTDPVRDMKGIFNRSKYSLKSAHQLASRVDTQACWHLGLRPGKGQSILLSYRD